MKNLLLLSILLLSGCSIKYVSYNPRKYEPCYYRDPDTWKVVKAMCLKEKYWEEHK